MTTFKLTIKVTTELTYPAAFVYERELNAENENQLIEKAKSIIRDTFKNESIVLMTNISVEEL